MNMPTEDAILMQFTKYFKEQQRSDLASPQVCFAISLGEKQRMISETFRLVTKLIIMLIFIFQCKTPGPIFIWLLLFLQTNNTAILRLLNVLSSIPWRTQWRSTHTIFWRNACDQNFVLAVILQRRSFKLCEVLMNSLLVFFICF